MTPSTEMGHREPMTFNAFASSSSFLFLSFPFPSCPFPSILLFFFFPFWALALRGLKPYALTTWTSFHYLMSCSPPRMLPFGMEGCPGGEDIRHQPIWETIPLHYIPEPLGDGASGYRCPLLHLPVCSSFPFLPFLLFIFGNRPQRGQCPHMSSHIDVYSICLDLSKITPTNLRA